MVPLAASLRRGVRSAVLVWSALSLGGLVLLGLHLGLHIGSGPETSYLFTEWLYEALIVSGSLGVVARAALVREDRLRLVVDWRRVRRVGRRGHLLVAPAQPAR